MKVAILSANLGAFDKEVDNCMQELSGDVEMTFHRFTDKDFPPCVGLTPRLQYRIPKMFGWQMFPGYDFYLWLDGSMSMQDPHSLMYFVDRCRDNDIVVFKHPWRNTILEETAHIEDHLKKKKPYITTRYKGGFHQQQYEVIKADKGYQDTVLYASTAFMYKNTPQVRGALSLWWQHTSRFFTVDQIAMPYVFWKAGLKVKVIPDNQYHFKYLTLTSKHG